MGGAGRVALLDQSPVAFTTTDGHGTQRPGLNWSPGSDSHRRIRVYETRPVAAEARGLWKFGALTWICTTNLLLRRAACRTNYTLRAACAGPLLIFGSMQIVASEAGLAPARVELKIRLLELLCIHGQKWMVMESKAQSRWLTGQH